MTQGGLGNPRGWAKPKGPPGPAPPPTHPPPPPHNRASTHSWPKAEGTSARGRRKRRSGLQARERQAVTERLQWPWRSSRRRPSYLTPMRGSGLPLPPPPLTPHHHHSPPPLREIPRSQAGGYQHLFQVRVCLAKWKEGGKAWSRLCSDPGWPFGRPREGSLSVGGYRGLSGTFSGGRRPQKTRVCMAKYGKVEEGGKTWSRMCSDPGLPFGRPR